MNVGDYYTNGKRVVHIQARALFGDWHVLIWGSATASSSRHLISPEEMPLTLIGHRKLTPAEVRQWVAGGPVPGRDEP